MSRDQVTKSGRDSASLSERKVGRRAILEPYPSKWMMDEVKMPRYKPISVVEGLASEADDHAQDEPVLRIQAAFKSKFPGPRPRHYRRH